MENTNPPKPAPLGGYRNPYEFLRAPDVEAWRKIADLKTAGTVTDQAVEEIRQEGRRALSLAIANHRENIRALAWRMLRTREAPPVDMQYEFLADKRGDCAVLSLVSLIAAEVTANDYPHDLPFHPDAHELAEAISRNHRSALQIVKDRIRTGALPVRAVTGIPVAYNDDPAVLAWCNDIEAIRPPQALTTTLADARALVQAIGLNPVRELAGESAPIPEQVTELAGELAPPSDQVPNVPAKEAPPDLEAPKRIGRRPKAASGQAPDENAAPATAPSDTRDEALREYDALLAGGSGKNEAARQVAEKYRIPRSTLRDRIKRRDANAKRPWGALLSQAQRR
ncbi:hypothetical protein [Thauera sp. AutoDN2]|uniref:hypothetical protein n=1 Tax=Thauera sp. AutoDN2 TaxID=3416051 RepID=UPI003F4B1689